MLLLVSVNVAPSQAANKSKILTKAFQKYLADGETEYEQSLADAKALYEPQINAASVKLQAAQRDFAKVNQVTILKTTSHSPTATVLIDAVNCPTRHSDCKHPVYKTNEFTAGEVATVYDFIGGDAAFFTSFNAQMNSGMLQTIDLQVKDGLIRLNNPTAYADVVNTIRTQYQATLTLASQYLSVKNVAESALRDVQSMEDTISSAIVAAKRAEKNSSTFEKAFVTAFKFEYNAQRLDELARAPWTYISSLKALRDAVSVTKQSELADSISSRYSFKAASSFNSTYGNLFLSEPSYKEAFQLVASIYRSSTGKSSTGKL